MIVKVCGLTRAEDVALCAELAVDLLGFIFHPQSPRHVQPDWVATQRPKHGLKVGVFVNQGVEEIATLARKAKLDLIQLHGGQSEVDCQFLGPGRVIKTLWPVRYARQESLLAAMDRFASVCRAVLLDGGHGGGGHGQTVAPQKLPGPDCHHVWYLAGGLNPDNVAHVHRTSASGVDLNSGVESAPGIKDHEKLHHVMRILRGLP